MSYIKELQSQTSSSQSNNGEDEDYDDFDDQILENNDSARNDENSIKTFLRIRNDLPMDMRYKVADNCLQIQIEKNGQTKYDSFIFDEIFARESTQQDIFKKCALPLIVNFIYGKNSLIFTLGVTSSGKTFTMKGTTEHPGIVPQSLVMLFNMLPINVAKVPKYKPIYFCDRVLLSNEDQEYENEIRKFVLNYCEQKDRCSIAINHFASKENEIFNLYSTLMNESMNNLSNTKEVYIWVSYFEIYNENFIDLLNVKKLNEPEVRLCLNHDTDNNYYLNGLRKVFVTSAADAYAVYMYGQENLKQHISHTIHNDRSSRSHSIFTITMIRTTHDLQTLTSHLNFCDLAGSERFDRLGQAPRSAETCSINKSLSFLNQCMASLVSRKKKNIQFRNCKLTHILQPYLFSNGGIFNIIFNLNPLSSLVSQSIYSLNWCDYIKQLPKKCIKLYKRSVSVSECNGKIIDEQMLDELDKTIQICSRCQQTKKDCAQLLVQNRINFEKHILELEKQNKEQNEINEEKLRINNVEYERIIEDKNNTIEQLQNNLFENNTELSELRAKLEEEMKKCENLKLLTKEVNEKCVEIAELQTKLKEEREKSENLKCLLEEYANERLEETMNQRFDIENVFSNRKRKSVLTEKQMTTKKIKFIPSNSSSPFSPEMMFAQIKSSQKMNRTPPYNTRLRARKKLF